MTNLDSESSFGDCMSIAQYVSPYPNFLTWVQRFHQSSCVDPVLDSGELPRFAGNNRHGKRLLNLF